MQKFCHFQWAKRTTTIANTFIHPPKKNIATVFSQFFFFSSFSSSFYSSLFPFKTKNKRFRCTVFFLTFSLYIDFRMLTLLVAVWLATRYYVFLVTLAISNKSAPTSQPMERKKNIVCVWEWSVNRKTSIKHNEWRERNSSCCSTTYNNLVPITHKIANTQKIGKTPKMHKTPNSANLILGVHRRVQKCSFLSNSCSLKIASFYSTQNHLHHHHHQ